MGGGKTAQHLTLSSVLGMVSQVGSKICTSLLIRRFHCLCEFTSLPYSMPLTCTAMDSYLFKKIIAQMSLALRSSFFAQTLSLFKQWAVNRLASHSLYN